jgi:hypothetical protein
MNVSGELVEYDNQCQPTTGSITPVVQLRIISQLQQVSEALLELPVEIGVLFEPAGMLDVLKPKFQNLIDRVFVHGLLSNGYR